MEARRRRVSFTSASTTCHRISADQINLLDPNAPKRGLSAYMFFANEQRDNVREENPGISFGKIMSRPPAVNVVLTSSRNSGQVGKVLGERWKALSNKQREPYEAKAKTDKQRYEDEKASYNVREPAIPCRR